MPRRTHHHLHLFIREEPEGHATFFIDWSGKQDPDNMEAVALIEKDLVDEVADGAVFEKHVANLIIEHAPRFANVMMDCHEVEETDE